MPAAIPLQLYDSFEQKFGKQEARGMLDVFESLLKTFEKNVDDTLIDVRQNADATLVDIQERAEALITRKKFELKNELTTELATKADIARLEGGYHLLSQEAQAFRQEVAREFQAVKQESATKTDIARLEGEIRLIRQGVASEFQVVRQEMAKEFQTVRFETDSRLQKVELEMQNLRQEIRQEMQLNKQEMQTNKQEMATMVVKLDRKVTIMFLALFFSMLFLNQNSLEFLAKVIGLIR